ncbi:hypothetical protein NM688_g8762 [Phlebia brevispora]|uniref:Uncharacterized protein n=1 Tax=Phlebia brevispora TaxID=194682 RepID=A0ACC1RPM2_9APHY|nr:hypothetical protein NM688_g8762 [Phlebia brevispora]
MKASLRWFFNADIVDSTQVFSEPTQLIADDRPSHHTRTFIWWRGTPAWSPGSLRPQGLPLFVDDYGKTVWWTSPQLRRSADEPQDLILMLYWNTLVDLRPHVVWRGFGIKGAENPLEWVDPSISPGKGEAFRTLMVVLGGTYSRTDGHQGVGFLTLKFFVHETIADLSNGRVSRRGPCVAERTSYAPGDAFSIHADDTDSFNVRYISEGRPYKNQAAIGRAKEYLKSIPLSSKESTTPVEPGHPLHLSNRTIVQLDRNVNADNNASRRRQRRRIALGPCSAKQVEDGDVSEASITVDMDEWGTPVLDRI